MTSESQAKVNSTNWARVLTHSIWKVFQWILAFLWMPIVAIIIRDIPTKCVKQPPSKEDPEGKLILTGKRECIQVIADYAFRLGDQISNYDASFEYAKMFGNVLIGRIPFYKEYFVNLADFEVAKWVMSSPGWYNRTHDDHYLHTATFNKPLGLLFGNGEHWRQSRRLTLKLLHQLDFFKTNKMENWVSFEVAEVQRELQRKIDAANGELYHSPHQMFEVPTLNVVCQTMMGERFHHDDPIVWKIVESMNKMNREFSLCYSPLDIFRWLKYVPRFTFLGSFQNCSYVFYDYFREIIAKRRQIGAYKDQPTDFVDGFLLEIDKQAKENPCYITDEAFLALMRDMVFAGMDTTNSAMEHGLLNMALNKTLQDKVQAEIDEVIGSSRAPVYDDKARMIYTQAVILEILRTASPVPMTSRSNLKDDASFLGFKVPKGTMVAINIYAMHRSKELWEDPNVFRPERFLSADGELVNVEKIMPFGYGKRMCLGETVARCTLFIFFVSMLQNFTFEMSDRHSAPTENVLGLTRCPQPYHLKIRRRNPAEKPYFLN